MARIVERAIEIVSIVVIKFIIFPWTLTKTE